VQLFDAEILNVVLKFANPDEKAIKDAGKVTAYLSLALDNVVRKSLAAGNSIKSITNSIKSLGPEIDRLEKRAGLLASHSAAIHTSQQILGRYTPNRLETMQNFGSIKAAEKVEGSVASLGVEIKKLGNQLHQVLSSGSSLYPGTRNNPVGRAVVLDVETLGLNKAKHGVTEFTATVIEFNKLSGVITNQQKAIYHSYQDVAKGVRFFKNELSEAEKKLTGFTHQYSIARTRSDKELAALPANIVRAMVRQFGENAPARLSLGMTPDTIKGKVINPIEVAKIFKGVDLAIGHNVREFDKPHVERLVSQLKQFSGAWLDTLVDLKPLLKALGFTNFGQQALLAAHNIDPGQSHRSTDDTRSLIEFLNTKIPIIGKTYLGAMLAMRGEQTREQQLVSNLSGRADERINLLEARLGNFSRARWSSDVSARTRRAAHSTEYGIVKGAGQSPESTPAFLGNEQIRLQNEVSNLSRFRRYAAIMALDSHMSAQFMERYDKIASGVQFSQNERGKKRQYQNNVRSGEDLELASMIGTASFFERLEPGSYHGGPRQKYSRAAAYDDLRLHKILSQSWAKSEGSYGRGEIEQFVDQHQAGPSPANARTAAQMLNFVKSSKQGTDLTAALGRIVLHGYSKSTPKSGNRFYEQFLAEQEGDYEPKLLGPGKSGSKFKKVAAEFVKGSRKFLSEESGEEDVDREIYLGKMAGRKIKDFFSSMFGRNNAGQAQTERILGGDNLGPIDLKTEMRYDTFGARLEKLSSTIAATTRAFEHYSETLHKRKNEDIDERLETLQSKKAMRVVDAQLNATRVGSAVGRKVASVQNEDWFKDLKRNKPTEANAVLEAIKTPLRRATLQKAKAEYESAISGEVGEEAIESARRRLAGVYATQNKDAGVPGIGRTQQEETERIAGLLSGKTPAQMAATQKARLEEDLNKKRLDGAKKVEDLRKKGREEEEKFVKKEAELAGRGGGRGSGAGAGSAGEREFGQMYGGRGGGFGMGLMALAAYDVALRNLIKDMAVYAAKTQMMEMGTRQMAGVAGLDSKEVTAEVNAIKRLNVTTQVAHQTVQRLMMMQIDLAKGTKLVGVAQNLAAVTGADAMETITRLTSAVLTGYTRNLHMMGLQVTSIGVLRELRQQRKSEGKTGEPSMQEQRSALTNAIIMEGAKISGTFERSLSTAGGQFAYLRKEVQETMNAVGKEFLPSFANAMRVMSGGLHTVQENAGAFAKLTSVLTSLGSVFSVLGTAAFLRWAGTAMSIGGPWGVAAGVAAGAAGLITYAALNQDKGRAAHSLAEDQRTRIHEQLDRLKIEQQNLLDHPSNSKEWKQEYDTNIAAQEAFAKQFVNVNEDLTRNLAEEYKRRLKDFDEFGKAITGQSGFWETIAQSYLHASELFLPGNMPAPEQLEPGKKRDLVKRQILRKLAGPGASEEKINRMVEELDIEEKETKLPLAIRNEAQEKRSSFVSALRGAETLLSQYSAKYEEEPAGKMRERALRSHGTYREQVELEHQFFLDTQEKGLKEVRETLAMKETNPAEYRARMIQAGGGKGEPEAFGLGVIRTDKLKKDLETINKQELETYHIGIGKANQQTQIQVDKINEQVQVSRILGGVIKGNLDSEAAGMKAVYDLKMKDLELAKKKYPMLVDAHRITQSEIEAEKKIKQGEIDAEKARIPLELEDRRKAYETELGVHEILSNRALTPAEALKQAYALRIAAVGERKLGSTGEKAGEVQGLEQQGEEADLQLQDAVAVMESEARITKFGEAQKLKSTIDRITSSRGRTSKQRSLAEIQRTLDSETATAEKEYQERAAQPLGEGKVPINQRNAELEKQRDAEKLAAQVRAADETVKEMESRQERAVDRLHEYYQARLSDTQKISSATAEGSADEHANAASMHSLQLDYIDKELQARLAAGESYDEAERRAMKEKHDVEMEYYLSMLQQRKSQIDAIRSTSGDLFDIITSTSPNKQRQAKDYGIGLARNMGRTVFSNIAVSVLKSQSGVLGGIIPGQTHDVYDPKTGKTTSQPTWLGKILSGTPFGKGVTDKQIAAQKEQVEKTNENIAAEDKLTKAIDNLREAIEKARGLVVDEPFGVADSKISGGSTKFLAGLFKPSSTTNAALAINIAQVAGTALQNGVPVYLVDSTTGLPPVGGQAAANFVSSVLTSGGSGSTSASGTMGMLASMAGGLFKNSSSNSTPGAFNFTDSGGTYSDAGTMASSGIDQGGWGHSTADLEKQAAAIKSGQGKPNYLGGALMTGAGAYQAYTGFSKGGGSGVASGIGGVLTAGAGIAAMIPGGQVVAPFLAAGAMAADLIGSILGNSRQQREIDIGKVLANAKYIAPTQINREMDSQGNLVSTGAHGGLSRDTGIGAFPIDFTQTQYGRTPTKTWGDPNVPEYYTIPGQVQYGGLSSAASPTTYNVNITSWDSQDVLRRSGDIAAALKKEIQGGSDVSIALQQSMFGSGLLGG
jgi:hypothetical protein